jgi:hypothetical protein
MPRMLRQQRGEYSCVNGLPEVSPWEPVAFLSPRLRAAFAGAAHLARPMKSEKGKLHAKSIGGDALMSHRGVAPGPV